MPTPSELEVHKHVLTTLRMALPPEAARTLKHVPNGEKREAWTGRRLKEMGLLPGWPDLDFIYQGRTYTIEVKAPGGKLSKSQRERRDDIRAAGGEWTVVYDHSEIPRVLREWGIPSRAKVAA